MTLQEALLVLGLAWLAFSVVVAAGWTLLRWAMGPDPDDGPDGWDPFAVPMCRCGVRTGTPHLHPSRPWVDRDRDR